MKNRNCYCGKMEKSALEKEDVQAGYCGLCDICNAQGHLRHAPGMAPYTGAWCDKCFKIQSIINHLQSVGLPIVVISLILGQWALALLGMVLLLQGYLVNHYGKAIIKKLART